MSFKDFNVKIEDDFVVYSFRLSDFGEVEFCHSLLSVGSVFERLEVGTWVGESLKIKLNEDGSALIEKTDMKGAVARITHRYWISAENLKLFGDTVVKAIKDQEIDKTPIFDPNGVGS